VIFSSRGHHWKQSRTIQELAESSIRTRVSEVRPRQNRSSEWGDGGFAVTSFHLVKRGAARSACPCGVEWVDSGAGSGSASRSRVHMFRHSPDLQFKKMTTFAAFTASNNVAQRSYASAGPWGGALQPFPRNGYANNSLVER